MTDDVFPVRGRRHGAIRPLAHRAAGFVAGSILGVAVVLYLFEFAMNMHYDGGLPYWDDWQYFFGVAQGVQAPLTLASTFAKEADHVAPLFNVLTHVLWWAIGVDFLSFRFLGWLAFGGMLLVYGTLLRRFVVDSPWAGMAAAAAGLLMVSTANAEYFYYQHMGLLQPFFFIALYAFLYLMAAGRVWAAIPCMLVFGSTGVFGTSYVLGAAGSALVLAVRARLAGGRRRDWGGLLADGRVLVAVGGGFALTVAIYYITFHNSYDNHTGQALVGPWQADFWLFLFSAFAAAFGFSHALGDWLFLAVGVLGLALIAMVLVLTLFRPAAAGMRDAGRRDDVGDFVIASLLAGTILVVMVTGVGRAHLCGETLADVKSCGSVLRYVYPIVLALPVAVAGWFRVSPPGRLGGAPVRSAAIVAILALIAAGSLFDARFRPSLARWNFAGLNDIVRTRDAETTVCLAAYLREAVGTHRERGGDWSRPLICPGNWMAKDVSPYLHAAYQADAAFLEPILTGLERWRDPVELSLFDAGGLTIDGRTVQLALPTVTGAVQGWLDGQLILKDGTQVVIGWAADVAEHEPAARVVVVAGNRVVTVGRTGGERPDVVQALGDQKFKGSGFVIPLPAGQVPPGTAIRAFAITRSYTAAALNGSVVIAPSAP